MQTKVPRLFKTILLNGAVDMILVSVILYFLQRYSEKQGVREMQFFCSQHCWHAQVKWTKFAF